MPLQRETIEDILREYDPNRKLLRLDEVCSAVGSGENYTSRIRRVQADVELEDGKKTKMYIVVKVFPTEGKLLSFLTSEAFIETEIKLYEDILPKFEEVLKIQEIPPFWPTFYGCKKNYMLFSDLSRKGFIVKCRKTRLDLEHALLVMKHFAIFHAASVALEKCGKLNVSGLKPCIQARNSKAMTKHREGVVKVAARTILDQWGPKWSKIGQRLLDNSAFCHQIEKLIELDQSRLNVLCHGDIWTTNMMFKYDNQSQDKPSELRFLDFQLAHYNSFAYDLLFFIASSLPPDLRRKSKHQLLDCYITTLRNSLGVYGLAHLAPTMEEALSELKRLDLYYFLILFTEMAVMISDLEDACIMENFEKDDEMTANNPKLYEGDFIREVDEELLQWAEEGLF